MSKLDVPKKLIPRAYFVECRIADKVESPYFCRKKNFNFKKAEIQLKSS